MEFYIDMDGRLVKPPNYSQVELSCASEKLVLYYMQKHLGGYKWPIPTDVLVKLLEIHASDLDLYADLSEDEEGTTGATYVYSDQKPEVKVSRELSDGHHEHELRHTLAHEFAHTFFHGYFWYWQTPVFEAFKSNPQIRTVYRCKQAEYATEQPWAEIQAEFAARALLMPLSHLVFQIVESYSMRQAARWPFLTGSDHAERLTQTTASYFDVSLSEADTRLCELGFLRTTANS
jgi:Zn-dependent peptidase ImmA (M78 family)